MELSKFDTQKMAVHEVTARSQKPEISDVEYQQGELMGYEVREYLLEKFGRKCAYCGKENIPSLEVEHIIPKTRGGSNRVSNLTIACKKCNLRKGNQTAEEFGYPDVSSPTPEAGFRQKQAKKPLKDAAALNATRWAIYRHLQTKEESDALSHFSDLPIEIGTGGRTKFNRRKRKLEKKHWIDAACVGESTPPKLQIEGVFSLSIIATGHGNRQM